MTSDSAGQPASQAAHNSAGSESGGDLAHGTDHELGAGATERDGGPAPTGNVQNAPSMDMHDTSTQARVDGIVLQTRADFPNGYTAAEFEHALARRFDDVGIEVDAATLTRLASQ